MGVPHTALATTLLALGAILSGGCDDISAPDGGALQVVVATTGVDFDPDGYLVTAGGTPLRVAANGTATFHYLPARELVVGLEEVEPNCQVARNFVVVAVRRRLVRRVEFSVTCVSRVGRLRVTTLTTGAEFDPDGYRVRLDGGPDQAIGTSSTIVIENVVGGGHTVELRDVARNCTVSGGTQQSVNLPFGGVTVDVSFSVQCVTSGNLRITATTSGTDLDPNGYNVAVRATAFDTVAALPTVGGGATVSTLIPGDYEVTLAGVAANCDVTGPNPRRTTVAAGTTTAITFEVTCAPVTRLAIVKSTNGNADIWTVNSNGTGATRLTTYDGEDADPAWSPDGTRIAFSSGRDGNAEIYVMTADGSGVVRLTTHEAWDGRPAWSPDGQRIAFESSRDGDSEIYVMNADGSGVTRLTDNDKRDSHPDWSPDGRRIAFESDRSGNADIYVMNADGSGVTQLTALIADETQPAWSPDGTQLAFARLVRCEYYGCDHDLYVMNVDRPGVVQVTSGPEDQSEPAWSPDGRKIAFTLLVCNDYYCYDFTSSVMAVRVDGTNIGEVTNGLAGSPSWRR